MTREREIEGLLDMWLLDGPTQAPDRVHDVVADRIGRQSQRGAWRVGLTGIGAGPLGQAVGIAFAAVLVVAVLVALFTLSSDSRIASPSMTPGQPSPPAPIRHSENRFGISYEVPTGWVTTIDNEDWFSLAPPGGRMLDGGGGLSGQLDIDGIVAYRDPVIAAQDANCMKAAQPGLGHTVDDLVAYLRGHPGLVTSQPVPVTIAGMAGMQLDVSLAPTWKQTCPFNGLPSVVYMTHEGAPNYLWGVDGAEHQRMAFLTDDQGRGFVVGINALDAARLDEMAREAAPIVASHRIPAHGPPRRPTRPTRAPRASRSGPQPGSRQLRRRSR